MKKVLFMVAGVCAATAGFLVFGTKRMGPLEPVDQMARSLESAWADHHTVV